MAHVEKIRQQKLIVHQNALKEIKKIKEDAQKKHDEINRQTAELTQKAIANAQNGVKNLENEKKVEAKKEDKKKK